MPGNDLNDLETKIAQFKSGQKAAAPGKTDADAQNMNLGMRAGVELVASIGAGLLIGYFLDKWLDTRPLFLIMFFLAGAGAAFMNIYRLTQNIGSAVGYAPLHNAQKDGKKTPEKDQK